MDKAQLRRILDTAVADLREIGSLRPMVFIEGLDESVTFGITQFDHDDKSEIMRLIGKKSAHVYPRSVTFVSLAWFSEHLPMQGRHVADLPDKKECLIVVSQSPGEAVDYQMIPLIRIGEDVILGETKERSRSEIVGVSFLEPFWRGVAEGLGEMDTTGSSPAR